jgi:hypothetical protein
MVPWLARTGSGPVAREPVGVPLDGGSHQVLVGGDLLDTGHATVAYTASIEDYIAAALG